MTLTPFILNQPYNHLDVEKLYKLIGESIWHLQHLEYVLSTYTSFVIMQRKKDKGKWITESDATHSLNGQQKQVLGQLIGSAKKQKTIPEHMHSRFDEFLDQRNWVIHKCVINEYLSLRNKNDKNILFSKLSNFAEEAKQLTKVIHCEFEAWFEGCGYSIEEAHMRADKILTDAEKS